jgi:hypothetical protein
VNLDGEVISYKFKGSRPNDTTILADLHQFLDNYTLLQATDPKNLPPFPRMRLNQTIKKYGWFPTEIQLHASKNNFFRTSFWITSKHTLVNELSENDKEQIQKAKSKWMSFERVNLSEYRGLRTTEVSKVEQDQKR